MQFGVVASKNGEEGRYAARNDGDGDEEVKSRVSGGWKTLLCYHFLCNRGLVATRPPTTRHVGLGLCLKWKPGWRMSSNLPDFQLYRSTEVEEDACADSRSLRQGSVCAKVYSPTQVHLVSPRPFRAVMVCFGGAIWAPGHRHRTSIETSRRKRVSLDTTLLRHVQSTGSLKLPTLNAVASLSVHDQFVIVVCHGSLTSSPFLIQHPRLTRPPELRSLVFSTLILVSAQSRPSKNCIWV